MEAPPNTKRRGCLWAALGLAAFAALGLTALLAGLALISRSVPLPTADAFGADQRPELKEVWSWGSGPTKVVAVPLKGLILLDGEGDWFGAAAGTAEMALRAIRRATCDDEVMALILEVDSGGGGITASDLLFDALQEFREAQEGRRVVAVFHDVAASGAYYVALAADCIVAHPTTVTGSIGVLIQSFNLKELGQKIGLKDVTIKSGSNKDILNPFTDLSPEQHAMLQEIVDELHGRFVRLVATQRQLPEEQVRALADGRIFTASTALSLGLVDELGYWQDAVAKTAELLGVDEVKIYRYEERLSLAAFLRAATHWDPASDLFLRLGRARLLYLWQL